MYASSKSFSYSDLKQQYSATIVPITWKKRGKKIEKYIHFVLILAFVPLDLIYIAIPGRLLCQFLE